ncbi:hypothetical protein [Thalassomonas haliotis]|uniref:Energy transducer TonB n=1 Tax=Thalassomonas haliotis TaxID=485448 RepID=A0ABY7VFP8_9GAMM|nr:hypothetical protein [Thalassomonas haliotis]WDE12542.1 hypothetical protein H3N35_03430 [Thalassomonas haliotis]
MLNRRYTAVILSLIVHGILLLLLLTMTTRLPQPDPVTKPAIKSYLYIPKPEIKILEVPITPSEPIAEKEQFKKPLPPANKKEALSAKKTPAIDQVPPVITDKKQQSEATTAKAPGMVKKSEKKNKTPKKFSARNQLQKLTNSINNQLLQEGMSQYQQHKSPSVMHGKQQPVPHSKKTIDADQKKADSTTEYSQGMSITKHDDGTCSVTEDLSNVGMEGLSATQSFNCGISKEEKYFKEHMKNVLKKLGK